MEDLVPEYGFDTYLVNKKKNWVGMVIFAYCPWKGILAEVSRPAFYYETLSGYHGAKLRLYQDYLENILFDSSSIPNANGLDLLNTRYVVVPGGQLPGATVVFKDEQTGFLVLERKNALPRAYFVGATEVITSPKKHGRVYKAQTFDLSNTAVLPADTGISTTPIDSSSTAIAVLKVILLMRFPGRLTRMQIGCLWSVKYITLMAGRLFWMGMKSLYIV